MSPITDTAPGVSIACVWAIGALVTLVAYKLLRAATIQSSLFAGSVDGTPEGERVLAFAGTLVALCAYVAECLAAGSHGVHALVEPKDWMVWLTGGSQLSYLVGKAHRQRREE